MTAIVYTVCVTDHFRTQISQFIFSCSLFEGLLKFFLLFFIFGFVFLILILQILYDISEIWFIIFSRIFIPTQHVHALFHSFFLSVPNFEFPYLNLLLWYVNHTRNWTSTLYWTFVHASTASVKTYIQLLTPRSGLFLEKLLSSSVNTGTKHFIKVILSTAHCHKPHESSPHRHTQISKVTLILSSHIVLGLQMLYLLRVLEIKIVWIFSSPTRVMAHTSHPPWFDHINNIWFKLRRASQCSSLQPPATSPLSGLDILPVPNFKIHN